MPRILPSLLALLLVSACATSPEGRTQLLAPVSYTHLTLPTTERV